MAGVKISELPALATPSLSGLFPMALSGVTYKVTFDSFSSYYATNSFAVTLNSYTLSPVYAATTNNLANVNYNNGASGVGATITAINNGVFGLDSLPFASIPQGARILVKNEPSSFRNGIYILTDTGATDRPFILTRSTDFDEFGEMPLGAKVVVLNGGQNGNTEWYLASKVNTIGTDDINFVKLGNNPAALRQRNLSDLSDITTARTNLGLGTAAVQPTTAFQQIGRTTVNAANYTANANDRYIGQTGNLTVPITIQLPLSSSVPAGTVVTVSDESGTCDYDDYITVKSQSSDKLNDDNAYEILMNYPYATATFRTNGTNGWAFVSNPNIWPFRLNLTMTGARNASFNNVRFQSIMPWLMMCMLPDSVGTATLSAPLVISGIPAQYRPGANVNTFALVLANGNQRPGACVIANDGTITIYADANGASFTSGQGASFYRQMLFWTTDFQLFN